MIKSVKMKNCVPFADSVLGDCKEINFVFGTNGSGKTTISEFLSGADSVRFGESKITWDGPSHETVYVYNKSFMNRNFKQTIPGIFTLGEDAASDIQELEQLKKELAERQKEKGQLSKQHEGLEKMLPDLEKKFQQKAWELIYTRNKADFRRAFKGFSDTKKRFAYELIRRAGDILDQCENVCEKSDLIERAGVLFSDMSAKCEKFSVDIQAHLRRVEEIRNNPLWSTVIVGSTDIDIAALIRELNNSSWVHQGLKYIPENSMICPFCQQETITEEFRQKLESFFDAEYRNKLGTIQDLARGYREAAEQVIAALESVVDDKAAIETGRLDTEKYSLKYEHLISMFHENEAKISKKINEPGIKIDILDISQETAELLNMLDEANTLIGKHNELLDKRSAEEKRLINDIWAYCIHEKADFIRNYLEDIEDKKKTVDGLKKSLQNTEKLIDSLTAKIAEKTKNITSVQPTIEEINRSLRAYGFTNFSIQAAEDQENYYCIRRDDGSLVENSLSEGEETFLTFLYFMQMVKGSYSSEHVADKKIIVIDDPVSSLDSTVLYVVGAMVKELCDNIRNKLGDVVQIFIFTHNVFFHRETSFNVTHNQKPGEVQYWIIRKYNGISEIKPKSENPILSSYELLWRELRGDSNASRVSVQNTMRRILEYYFKFLGGDTNTYDKALKSFETLQEKRIIESLFQWVNDGSHVIPDDIFVGTYDTDSVQKYKDIFREIFKRSGHIAHYNMMMRISCYEAE